MRLESRTSRIKTLIGLPLNHSARAPGRDITEANNLRCIPAHRTPKRDFKKIIVEQIFLNTKFGIEFKLEPILFSSQRGLSFDFFFGGGGFFGKLQTVFFVSAELAMWLLALVAKSPSTATPRC